MSRVATHFTVRSGGLLTTVQDRGRFGSRRLGVPISGALDAYAMRVANLLVGNDADAAVLECTVRGPVIRFDHDSLVAICGGEFDTTLDGVPVLRWRPVYVEAGSVLAIGQAQRGLRCCVAVAGGIDTPPMLGSRSTYLRAQLGGHEGRALKAGDTIPLGRASTESVARFTKLRATPARWFVDVPDVYGMDPDTPVLRAAIGAHSALLPGYSDELFRGEFTITPASDRMGYRLSADFGSFDAPAQLISEPVVPGTVQQPPGAEAIVLLADAQTTGGYARVAHVAAVDLPRIAQASPGARVRFQHITHEESMLLLRRRERELARLAQAVQLRLT